MAPGLRREPLESQLKDSIDFIAKQSAYFKAHPALPASPSPTPAHPSATGSPPQPTDPDIQSLTTFCHALLTSNAFLYSD